jgi:Protein of unknown function (DUF3303)
VAGATEATDSIAAYSIVLAADSRRQTDWVQHHTIVAEETFFDCGAFPLGNAAWQCIQGEKDEKIDPFICRKAPEQTMLFMIIERFKDNDMLPIYKRVRDEGRMIPGGLKYVDSWVEPNFSRCFQLMELR